jgi:hypothetical protein
LEYSGGLSGPEEESSQEDSLKFDHRRFCYYGIPLNLRYKPIIYWILFLFSIRHTEIVEKDITHSKKHIKQELESAGKKGTIRTFAQEDRAHHENHMPSNRGN